MQWLLHGLQVQFWVNFCHWVKFLWISEELFRIHSCFPTYQDAWWHIYSSKCKARVAGKLKEWKQRQKLVYLCPTAMKPNVTSKARYISWFLQKTTSATTLVSSFPQAHRSTIFGSVYGKWLITDNRSVNRQICKIFDDVPLFSSIKIIIMYPRPRLWLYFGGASLS